jgi:tetratricopeptide (TPR) repeat protein
MPAGVALALLLAAAPAPASPDGRLAFGTKSEAAATAVREALDVLVRTRDLAAVETLAQKAVDADRQFALARYLLSVGFRPSSRDAADVQLAKTKELLPEAPDGERRFIETSLSLSWESVEAWRKLAAEFPKEGAVHLGLAEAWLSSYQRRRPRQESDLDAAREAFESVLSLEPRSAVAHGRLGWVNTIAGEHPHALEHYLEGRGLLGAAAGCHSVISNIGLAVAHLYVGQYKEAQILARQCRDEYDESEGVGAPAWNLVGRILLETGDAEGGLAAYEQGRAWIERTSWSEDEQTQRQVWLGRYHHGRGRSLARLGKQVEAWAEVETVKKMIDGGGEDGRRYLPAWHYLAGYVKLEAGDAESAIQHLEQAETDRDAFRTLLLARAHLKLGHKDEARRLYRAIADDRTHRIELALSYFEAKESLKRLE